MSQAVYSTLSPTLTHEGQKVLDLLVGLALQVSYFALGILTIKPMDLDG
jgi:hypothetical protein